MTACPSSRTCGDLQMATHRDFFPIFVPSIWAPGSRVAAMVDAVPCLGRSTAHPCARDAARDVSRSINWRGRKLPHIKNLSRKANSFIPCRRPYPREAWSRSPCARRRCEMRCGISGLRHQLRRARSADFAFQLLRGDNEVRVVTGETARGVRRIQSTYSADGRFSLRHFHRTIRNLHRAAEQPALRSAGLRR